MIKKLLIFLLFSTLLGYTPVMASHLIGGDVTYRCLGNNQFEVTLTIFQDCLNGNQTAIRQDNPAYYTIYEKGTRRLIRSGHVNAVSIDTVPTGFSNRCIDNYPVVCLRREVFDFDITLPPTTKGYYIVYQRCCRNAQIINLINPGNVGVTYYAEIPPFTNGVCPNNSATFNNKPPQIICSNNPFYYDASATDPDGDSLSYGLCEAYLGGSVANPRPTGSEITPPPFHSVPYKPPYTANQPIPGVPSITIDPETGIMTGVPSQNGRFVLSICVYEWRDGIIINTLHRDIQFIITDCSKNVLADMPTWPGEPETYEIVCDGYTVHFRNTSHGGNSYFWDLGVPGATSTQFEPTYTYPDTGVYHVKLTVNPNSTCEDSVKRLVKIYPYLHVGFTYEGGFCSGDTFHFVDTSTTTYPPITFRQWNFGHNDVASDSTVTYGFPPPGGTQHVTLIDKTELGCIDSATVQIPLDYIHVFAGNDTTIVKDYPYQFHGSGADEYSWSPTTRLSNPHIPNPTATFHRTGRYTYILNGITTEHGCEDADTITINVVSTGTMFVPTAFSPNGDGLNDLLKPFIIGFKKINSFSIFNRFGQLVFATQNNNEPKWDGTMKGKPCNTGVYFWKITATDANGQKVTKTGDVTLLR